MIERSAIVSRSICCFVLGVGLAGCDSVEVVNAPLPTEWGMLVDGTRAGGPVNDQRYRSTNRRRWIGRINAGSASNEEVTAFTNGRPVALEENVGWTSSAFDRVRVDFPNRILIPVTVWIVRGPFIPQRNLALNHLLTTATIWNNERMGIGFSAIEIVNATGDPDAPTYFNFNCGLRAGIQTDIGRRANRINIYWVDTVDGGTGRGQACAFGSDFVAMGRATNDELLVHEFGHNFDLEHTNGQATFDQTNIMHSASSTREFITEGQLFRMHLDGNSALNTTYNARPGLPTRNCTHGASNNNCPAINTRLWADGVWPAN